MYSHISANDGANCLTSFPNTFCSVTERCISLTFCSYHHLPLSLTCRHAGLLCCCLPCCLPYSCVSSSWQGGGWLKVLENSRHCSKDQVPQQTDTRVLWTHVMFGGAANENSKSMHLLLMQLAPCCMFTLIRLLHKKALCSMLHIQIYTFIFLQKCIWEKLFRSIV